MTPRARNEFGYTRMWSIHPAQVPAIVAAFAPREDEIVTATEILLAAQSAQWGPTRHHDTLHDRASARSTGRTVPAEAAPLFATPASNKESAS
jgi:citrate lyase subunit beta/citryl-CoA lyase